MFTSILVPLDGSRLSEASLGVCRALVDRLGSSVTLLHVIERDAPDEVHRDRHLTTAKEAEAYLKQVADRSFSAGTPVHTHVHVPPTSDVARSIIEHAKLEMHADLIITCTHGNGGVGRLLFGSIAQRVVAQGQLPVLLVRPESDSFNPRTLLVPLDPDSQHDASLVPATALASACHASLLLLSVVPTLETMRAEEAAAGSLMPMTAKAMLDLLEEEATSHLQQHVSSLEGQGLGASAQIARGEPAAQITRLADERGVDLIVLSTHRKTGLTAFWSKSVAPRVAQATKKPLLLLPLD